MAVPLIYMRGIIMLAFTFFSNPFPNNPSFRMCLFHWGCTGTQYRPHPFHPQDLLLGYLLLGQTSSMCMWSQDLVPQTASIYVYLPWTSFAALLPARPIWIDPLGAPHDIFWLSDFWLIWCRLPIWPFYQSPRVMLGISAGKACDLLPSNNRFPPLPLLVPLISFNLYLNT